MSTQPRAGQSAQHVPGPRPPEAPNSAQFIAGFEVLAALGGGAGSQVFRVRRSSPKSAEPLYALKIQDQEVSRPEQAVAFRREAAMLASVDHPKMLSIHEVGSHQNRPYLVMDLVEGVALEAVLEAGPLQPEAVIRLALDIIGPLAAAHQTGLVHRDLKPENMMVEPDGTARLIDFGLLARQATNRSGAVVGTLSYAAPEQSGTLKRPVDNRSDLYSLGVVLFRCLAGVLPFVAAEVADLLRMHAVAPPPDLEELVPALPPGLAAIVAKLLAKDPEDRYQSGAELEVALKQLQGKHNAMASVDTTPRTAGRTGKILSGRTQELLALQRNWQATLEETGQSCVIRAGAGMGKSRLAAELATQVSAAGFLVLQGKCSADDPLPLAPLRTAIESHLSGADHSASPDLGLANNRVRAAMGSSETLLGSLTPALAALRVETADEADRPGADVQDQFTMAVAGFLTDLARQWGGLLLVVDDIQWLDPGSARVLGQVSGLLAGVPLMVLATARNDAESSAAAEAVLTSWGSSLTLNLELEPLDVDGTAELLRTLLPSMSEHGSLAELLRERGDGNPFVMIEYLRAIVDAGLLRPSWGEWLLDEDGLAALELPQDALGLVLTRVHGLSGQAHELLVTAAVVGSRFSPDLLAAVHDLSQDVVLQAVTEAADHSLVHSRGPDEFAFLHDRIREALLAEVTSPEMVNLHARIAERLSAMAVPAGGHSAEHVYAVAHHLLNTGLHEEPLIDACWEAGRLALASHAAAEAVMFLTHAATAWEHAGQRIEDRDSTAKGRLLLDWAKALMDHSEYVRARDCLKQALAIERRPADRAALFAMLAQAYRSNWDPDQAAEEIALGLHELDASIPAGGLKLVLSTLGLFAAGKFRQWTGWRVGRSAEQEQRRCTLIAELHEVGTYASAASGKPAQALVHAIRGVYWVNRVGSGPQYVRSQGMLAFIWGIVGLQRASLRIFARVSTDVADPHLRAVTANYQGASMFLGYHDNGAAWYRALRDHGQQLELANFCDAVSGLTMHAVALGDTGEAERMQAIGRGRLALRPGEVTSLIYVEPIVHASAGRPREAIAAMTRLAEELQQTSRSITLWRLFAEVLVLYEQNETGELFDQAVAEYQALAVSPAEMLRPERFVHFAIAMGRLAQCRRPSGADDSIRLELARKAVRELGKARKSEDLRARERIARADLLVVEGQFKKALSVLADLEPLSDPDSPLLAYETARVRSRAIAGLGGVEEAQRQASLAFLIAQRSGWPHRCAWIVTEFGQIGAGTAGSQGSAGSSLESGGWDSGSSTNSGVEGGIGADRVVRAGVDRQRLAALEQMSAAASTVLDPTTLVRITLDETIRILGADRAYLFLVGESDQLIPSQGRDVAGHDVTALTGYSASLVDRVHRTGKPLIVTGTDEGAALGAQSVVLHGLRSILVAPLQLDGRLLGVVYLDSQIATGIFDTGDVGILVALTNHIATSLETARAAQLAISVQAVQRERDLAETLRSALEAMNGALAPKDVLEELLTWALTMSSGHSAWLLLQDGDRIILTGRGREGVTSSASLELGPDLSLLMTTERPLFCLNPTVPDVLLDHLGSVSGWICLPLRSRDTSLGLLLLSSTSPNPVLKNELEIANTLVLQGMTAHEKATLLERVQSLAVTDELTGLSNRRHFFEAAHRDVAGAARGDRTLAMLMIDIDHFKQVNDTHGHPTGDDVIRIVGQRLAAVIRQGDLIARYGGEEFAVLLPDAGLDNRTPERLRAVVADEPISTRSGPLTVTISVGLTYLRPEDTALGTENSAVEIVLARADGALYEAKQSGRNCVRTH